MQKPIQKFRQNSIVFEKPGILPKNLKTLTSSNYPTVKYFFNETSHTFPTYQCLQKGVREFFYFVYVLSYSKKLKRPGFYTLIFYIFINNSRSKKLLKNPEHPFLAIIM